VTINQPVQLQLALFGGNEDGKLSAKHYEMLSVESAISDAVISSRGYWSSTDPGDLRALNFSKDQVNGMILAVPEGETFSALIIPVWDANGRLRFHRCRPDHPRPQDKPGRYVKYEQPAGTGTVLDIPPLSRPHLKNASVRLWVVEGERKADSLVSAGEAALAVHGVGCWQTDGVPKEDWEEIRLIGRETIVCFDGDADTNLQVRRQRDLLARYLHTRGAQVQVVRFPDRG
jgi:hypothetical protein